MEIMEMKALIESAAHTLTRNLCSVDQVDATVQKVMSLLCCGVYCVYCEFIVTSNYSCCRFCCLHSAARSDVGKKHLPFKIVKLHSKYKLTAPVSVSNFHFPVL